MVGGKEKNMPAYNYEKNEEVMEKDNNKKNVTVEILKNDQDNSKIDERKILDSGNRTQFSSGAVRDIQGGKGAEWLLPLDVVNDVFFQGENYMLIYLQKFKETSDRDYLRLATLAASSLFQGTMDAIIEVSKHYEEGAKKYGPSNWKLGIDLHCYIDSALRHYFKHLRGDIDEPHDRAVVWNLMCALWTFDHKPELDDYTEKGANNHECHVK